MLSSIKQPMAAFQTISDSYRFIDWLVASSRLEDLRWQNDYGMTVHILPSNDLFMDADESLADAWENLSWDAQRFCIHSAADWLADIESMKAGAI